MRTEKDGYNINVNYKRIEIGRLAVLAGVLALAGSVSPIQAEETNPQTFLKQEGISIEPSFVRNLDLQYIMDLSSVPVEPHPYTAIQQENRAGIQILTGQIQDVEKKEEDLGPYGFHLEGILGKELVICGTKENPVNGCGHVGIGYPQECDPYFYNCVDGENGKKEYSDEIKHSIDMVSLANEYQNNAPVYLPLIRDKDGFKRAKWTHETGPDHIGLKAEWGWKHTFVTELGEDLPAGRQGFVLKLNLSHVNANIGDTTLSGEQIATLFPNIDDPKKNAGRTTHLHLSIFIENKKTGKGEWIDPMLLGIGTENKNQKEGGS